MYWNQLDPMGLGKGLTEVVLQYRKRKKYSDGEVKINKIGHLGLSFVKIDGPYEKPDVESSGLSWKTADMDVTTTQRQLRASEDSEHDGPAPVSCKRCRALSAAPSNECDIISADCSGQDLRKKEAKDVGR
ncbi:hypothetical protein B0H14DRAFT_2628212 [Mycena olivaceomarginata]|nr:hypothetical protein B0H14DRAFT_2628212 [Mycena olivaceomarginata]